MKKLSLLIILRSIFGAESFSAPIIAFFYLNHIGVSFAEYSLSLTIVFFISAFLQVPMGIISDKFGRKNALILGELLYATIWLALILHPSSIIFYLSVVIMPIAVSLSSGNLESLAYEAVAGTSYETEFKLLMKNVSSYSVLFGAIAGVIGGYISKYNVVLPVVIDTAILYISTLLTWIIIPNVNNLKINQTRPSIRMITKTALDFSLSTPVFLNKIMIGAILFSVVRTLFTIYGPLISEASFDFSQIGLIIGLLSFISFCLIRLLPRYISKFDNENEIEVAMLCLVCLSGLIGLWSYLIIGALLLQQILRILSQYYSRYYINKCIPVEHESRVTLISFSYFVNMFTAGIFGAVVSFFISISNVNVAFSSLCFIAAILIYLLIKIRKDSFTI